jgi:hypothetical protein
VQTFMKVKWFHSMNDHISWGLSARHFFVGLIHKFEFSLGITGQWEWSVFRWHQSREFERTRGTEEKSDRRLIGLFVRNQSDLWCGKIDWKTNLTKWFSKWKFKW